MSWAASKWKLDVRQSNGDRPDLYTYHDTREEAVDALIKREQAAINLAEKNIARNKANLRRFIKREGRDA